MSTIQRKIDNLQKQLAELEAAKEREAREAAVLEKAYSDLQEGLKGSDISFDSFVRYCYKDLKRVVAKIEKEKAKDEAKPADTPTPVTKKRGAKHKTTTARTTKKAGSRRGAKKAATIKIAPGRYTNIPPDTSAIYEIKDKGARPKTVKAYAEELGIDKFMETCQVKD